MTGKGEPDLATRAFIKLLTNSLAIPVIALVDGDPYGIEILSTYKYGSKKMKYDASLAFPQLKWIGIHQTDITEYSLLESSLLPLSEVDLRKIKSMLRSPQINSDTFLEAELKRMLENNKKLEIETIYQQGSCFLVSYLVQKIGNGQWC